MASLICSTAERACRRQERKGCLQIWGTGHMYGHQVPLTLTCLRDCKPSRTESTCSLARADNETCREARSFCILCLRWPIRVKLVEVDKCCSCRGAGSADGANWKSHAVLDQMYLSDGTGGGHLLAMTMIQYWGVHTVVIEGVHGLQGGQGETVWGKRDPENRRVRDWHCTPHQHRDTYKVGQCEAILHKLEDSQPRHSNNPLTKLPCRVGSQLMSIGRLKNLQRYSSLLARHRTTLPASLCSPMSSSNDSNLRQRAKTTTRTLHTSHTHSHSHGGHGHSHGHDETQALMSALSGSADAGSRITLIGLGANVGLTLTKGAAGWVMGSAALLADAAHSGSDLLADIVTLTTYRISRRPVSATHPFGYGSECWCSSNTAQQTYSFRLHAL